MSELNLTQAQIDEIKKCDGFGGFCKGECAKCFMSLDTDCEQDFYKIKYGDLEVKEQKPYTTTRLDYFVAHIVTGCLAKSCGSSNPKEIVDYAKELIAEIDKQEGEK